MVYVDDILVATKDLTNMKKIKTALMAKWRMTDSGDVGFILGLKIQRNRRQRQVMVSQPAYAKSVLERFNMGSSDPTATPAIKDNDDAQETSSKEVDQKYYMAIVGSLMWITCATRTDLAFVISYLSRHAQAPLRKHLIAAKRALRYLKGTIELELTFSADIAHGKKGLEGGADSDWAGDAASRKSTTGHSWTWHGNLVSWSSQRQKTTSESCTEGGLISIVEA